MTASPAFPPHPHRTQRTLFVFVVSLLFELPLLKLTFHALPDEPAYGVDFGPRLLRGSITASRLGFRLTSTDEPDSAS
jgi:hypothetical protein